MARRATIVDVAKLAGISVPTVSRVLSGSDYPVKESTRQAVLAAARKLNYSPNVFGRLLKGKRSQHIGLLIPSITNPFYSEIISSVQPICLERGYLPMVCSSQSNPELENNILDIFENERASGLLISCICWNESLEKRLDSMEIPYVLFDQVPPGYKKDYVGFDFYSAGVMATEHLISEGFRSIVFASGPINRESRKKYHKGVYDALKKASLDCSPAAFEILTEKEATTEDYVNGTLLASKLLARPSLPSAIAVVNDMTAIGVMNGLSSKGISIPHDISVVGFDNIPYSAMVSPGLTTIEQPMADTGTLAAKILIDKIEGKVRGYKHVDLKPVLIERGTVKKANR